MRYRKNSCLVIIIESTKHFGVLGKSTISLKESEECSPMHHILEVVSLDKAPFPSGEFKYASCTSGFDILSADSFPSGTGLATMTALQRSTMLLKSISAPFPAHCRLASAQIQTKRFMSAPCAAAATSVPKLLPHECDMSASAWPVKLLTAG